MLPHESFFLFFFQILLLISPYSWSHAVQHWSHGSNKISSKSSFYVVSIWGITHGTFSNNFFSKNLTHHCLVQNGNKSKSILSMNQNILIGITFIKLFLCGPYWWQIICLDNGCVPIWYKVIILINGDPFHWHIIYHIIYDVLFPSGDICIRELGHHWLR